MCTHTQSTATTLKELKCSRRAYEMIAINISIIHQPEPQSSPGSELIPGKVLSCSAGQEVQVTNYSTAPSRVRAVRTWPLAFWTFKVKYHGGLSRGESIASLPLMLTPSHALVPKSADDLPRHSTGIFH